jgi:hypothetical protein
MLTSAYLMPEGTRGRIRISFCIVKLFCSGSRKVADDIGYVQMFENRKAIISQRRHYGVDAGYDGGEALGFCPQWGTGAPNRLRSFG